MSRYQTAVQNTVTEVANKYFENVTKFHTYGWDCNRTKLHSPRKYSSSESFALLSKNVKIKICGENSSFGAP
jgi:hypothetical protein